MARPQLLAHDDPEMLGILDFADGYSTPISREEAPDLARALLRALPPVVVAVLAREALAQPGVLEAERSGPQPLLEEQAAEAEFSPSEAVSGEVWREDALLEKRGSSAR